VAPPCEVDCERLDPDAGVAPDAGGPVVVSCGDQGDCEDACCVNLGGQFRCGAACEGPELSVRCDGPEDCPGAKVCCGGLGGGECRDACRVEEFEACHVDEDCLVSCLACEFPLIGVQRICAFNCPD
jgi:hypothetical protein